PERFWSNFFQASASEHPALTALTRVILPTVLVTEAETISDFDPLLRSLDRHTPEAVKAFGYLLQGIRAVNFSEDNPEERRKYKLWVELLECASAYLDNAFAWDFGWINEHVLVFGEKDDRTDLVSAAGKIARIIFDWNWRQRGEVIEDWNYRLASVWAIPQI